MTGVQAGPCGAASAGRRVAVASEVFATVHPRMMKAA
jgi:hypothetical protein